MRRRQLLAGGVALAAGSGLSRPSLAAAPAGTLRFVPQADLSSLDPVWTTATVAFNHGMMVYDTLYGIDASLTPRPQMVAGHEVSDDGLSWTFTLRDGLVFHDDEPVRAIDCVASINRWGRRKGFGQQLLALTQEIAALDDRRFRIRLKSPFPLMTFALGGPDICMIMPERQAKVDAFAQVTDAIGSGPFRYLPGERVSGSFSAWERFAKYQPRQEPPSFWAGGKVANVARVEWRVIPDPATAANALQQGEVDWLESPLFDLLPTLRRQPGVKLVSTSSLPTPGVIALNHTQPPFDNPKLLRAILPAIDQAEFMSAVVGDQTDLMTVPTGVFTPGTPMASDAGMEVLTGKRDLALARKLVAESGYKGERIVLMSPSDYPTTQTFAQVAADLFKRLGLNVEYTSMDWGTLVQRRTSKEPVEKGGWSAFATTYEGLTVADPATHIPLRGNGAGGWFGWPTSPRLEALRDRWFDAPDETAQKRIAREMQAIVFEEVPFLPLGQLFYPTAYRDTLQDIVPANMPIFWNVRRP